MKTKQISAMIIITAAMLMGCKKNGTEPVSNLASVSQQTTEASSATWIASASADGISGMMIEGNYGNWIQPKNFVTDVNNQYFPLVPGDTLFYQNTVTDISGTTVEDNSTHCLDDG